MRRFQWLCRDRLAYFKARLVRCFAGHPDEAETDRRALLNKILAGSLGVAGALALAQSAAAAPAVRFNPAEVGVLATGGTTTRLLADVQADRINVRNLGVVGATGGATDETTAINNVLAICGTVGRSAYFPEGTYCHIGLAVPSGCNMVGDGPASVIQALSSLANHCIRVANGASNVTIANLLIDGGNAPNGLHAIAYASTNDTQPNTNCNVIGCTIQNHTLEAIYQQAVYGGTIERNYIRGNTTTLLGGGIQLDGININCLYNDIANTSNAGIGINNGGPYTFTPFLGYVLVQGNTIYNSSLSVANDNITGYASTSINVRVINNRCVKSLNHNIHIGGTGAEITGNYCDQPAYNNIFMACRIPGTETYAACTNVRVMGNTCLNAGTNYSGVDGDQLVNCVISANVISAAGGSGIAVNTATGTAITGNPISGSTVHGISVGGFVGGVISDNPITASGQCGISLGLDSASLASTGNSIGPNMIAGCGAPGIQSTSTCTGNVWFSNTITGCTYVNDINLSNGDFSLMNIGNVSTGIAFGQQGTKALGSGTIAMGVLAQTVTNYATAIGRAVTAQATYSFARGYNCTTKNRLGFDVYSSGPFAVQGDAQVGWHQPKGRTTTGTSYLITTDGNTISTVNSLPVFTDNTWLACKGEVIAINATTYDRAIWDVTFDVLRKVGVTTTTLYNFTATARSTNSSGASGWTVTAVATTTNGDVRITVAATTTVWVMSSIKVIEIAFTPNT